MKTSDYLVLLIYVDKFIEDVKLNVTTVVQASYVAHFYISIKKTCNEQYILYNVTLEYKFHIIPVKFYVQILAPQTSPNNRKFNQTTLHLKPCTHQP